MNNVNQNIYNDTLVELRVRMENKSGSVQKFCVEHDIDNLNLYKLFSKNSKREMSIGLFARICSALGNPVAAQVVDSNLSLKQYLEIDNNAVLKCIMALVFGGAQE